MAKFNYFTYKEKRFDKVSQKDQEDLVFDLINAFALMKTPTDTALLLHDLLTEREVKNLSKRLRIAKMLISGQGHIEIAQQLHCSFATVTKVRMWLENAGTGFKKVLERLPKRKNIYWPKKIPGIGYPLDRILLHHASLYLSKKEQKKLKTFLENLRAKSATDKDLKEEFKTHFQKP